MKAFRQILPIGCALWIVSFSIWSQPPEGYRLVWQDEFQGPGLDRTKWDYRGLGARRDAINVRDAVFITNGCLVILTYTKGGKHYTGMISTRGHFEPLYGYLEARIRFESAPGMWSAFWLQSPTINQFIQDPSRSGVEVDIIEHRATDRFGRDIRGRGHHAIHWGGYGKSHKSRTKLTKDMGLGRGFHIYGLEWTPKEYRFYIDGQCTWVIQPVSRRPEYIILSSEVQDKSWAGRIPKNGYGDRSSTKVRMVVDYVRYYIPLKGRDEGQK